MCTFSNSRANAAVGTSTGRHTSRSSCRRSCAEATGQRSCARVAQARYVSQQLIQYLLLSWDYVVDHLQFGQRAEGHAVSAQLYAVVWRSYCSWATAQFRLGLSFELPHLVYQKLTPHSLEGTVCKCAV